MIEVITDVLLNSGPIGALALYMMYLHRTQDKKHDKQQLMYLDKIESMRVNDDTARADLQLKYEKREDDLRDKYDHVITKIDTEKRNVEKEMSAQIEKAIDKIDNLSSRFDNLNSRFDDINTKIMNTNQRLMQLETQVQRLDGMLDGIKTFVNRQ